MILPIGTHLGNYFRLSRRNKNIEADGTLESIIINMIINTNVSLPARIFRSNGVTIPRAILNFSSTVIPYS